MQPRLSTRNIWKRYEECICEILAYALILLQNNSGLIRDENELNRKLYYCLKEANAHYRKLGRGVDTPFMYEARNQPSRRHRRNKAPRENMRPDFQSGFIDHSEPDPQKQDKFFCIECKRLGDPPSSRYILNENYVKKGIARFIEKQHGYAFEVESGAMVGYIESSDFDVVLSEVNTALIAFQPTLLQIRPSNSIWSSTESNLLEHTFERPFPISPFALKHFWIDLRGKLTPKPARKNKERSAKSAK
jgi:hypothetical protein